MQRDNFDHKWDAVFVNIPVYFVYFLLNRNSLFLCVKLTYSTFSKVKNLKLYLMKIQEQSKKCLFQSLLIKKILNTEVQIKSMHWKSWITLLTQILPTAVT